MRDERVGKLARILVDYSIGAGEGNQVLVSAEVGAGPLIGALYAQSGGKKTPACTRISSATCVRVENCTLMGS